MRINGNDRLYENVVRRELRTKPGDLFSKEALERSYREIAQMGHFNPWKYPAGCLAGPDQRYGRHQLEPGVQSKRPGGILGRLGTNRCYQWSSLKFTNFSMANLFHKSDNYRGFLPQGDGQTLTISGQTNGSYYQSYSVSFFDPWFGGKRRIHSLFRLSTPYRQISAVTITQLIWIITTIITAVMEIIMADIITTTSLLWPR